MSHSIPRHPHLTSASIDSPQLRSALADKSHRVLLVSLAIAACSLLLSLSLLAGCNLNGSNGDGTCEIGDEDCGPGGCNGFDDDEETMLPGAACISCHSPGNLEGEEEDDEDDEEDDEEDEDEDESFTIAGTVFATALGGGGVRNVTVRVTDADGAVIELSSNSAGNFFTNQPITLPVFAEVERNGEVLAMAAAVNSADCNPCHSCSGSVGAKLFAP